MESPDEELKDKWFLQVEDMKRFWSLRDQFEEIHFVAGVDISFVKGDMTNACAGIVVLSYPSLKPVYEKFVPIKLTVPYIPGFLAFREVGFLMELLDSLKQDKPEYYPQLVFVDGNGTHHPQYFGLACHLGVLCDIPTIGIGKTFLSVDGLHNDVVKKEFIEKCQKKGQFLKLSGPLTKSVKSRFVFGAAVATADNLKNALFVSPGHRISLETAIELTLKCCVFRQPEPIRYADHRSREMIKEMF